MKISELEESMEHIDELEITVKGSDGEEEYRFKDILKVSDPASDIEAPSDLPEMSVEEFFVDLLQRYDTKLRQVIDGYTELEKDLMFGEEENEVH